MTDERCKAKDKFAGRCWHHATPAHDRHYAKTPWGALEWTEKVPVTEPPDTRLPEEG